MNYEYKEEILLDIGPEPNCNYESESNRYYDKIDELDHVYAQAAKADEYKDELRKQKGILSGQLDVAEGNLNYQRKRADEYEAKAKAFDYIVATYENNTGLGEHDEDLTDFEAIVDSIEHGIQMVGYRENEEDSQ